MPQAAPAGRRDRSEPDSRSVRSLRRQLLTATLAVTAPLLVGGALWLLLMSRSAGSYEDRAHEHTRETSESVALLGRLHSAERTGSRYLEGGDARDRIAFRGAARIVSRTLGAEGHYDEPAERLGLAAIRRPWRSAQRLLASYDPATDAGVDRPGIDLEDRFEAEMTAATSALEQLMSDSQEEIEDDLAGAQRSARLNWLLGVSAVAIALLLAALLASRLSRSLVRPLQRLAHAARSFATGDLDHRVSLSGIVEVDEVATSFNSMSHALEQQRDELERQVFTDSLTGLANRALFEDRTRHALERATGAGERVAVLVVNLDGFKLVNDGLGHNTGDALLKQAAARMLATLRPSDTLARLGGDAFAVLLECVRGLDDALAAAERLRRTFEDPFTLRGSDVVVTGSVGIALSTESVRKAAELVRRADVAMDRAKANGGNAAEFFDPDRDDQAADRLEMASALRRAATRRELIVHYQPIIDLDSGEVRAAEALLRWNRPGRGIVPPLEFIPLAEETGAIVSLGEWVLNEACAEAQRWVAHGADGVPVTVNVSARQLQDPGFESTVANALAAHRLDPDRLILEVTESSVIQNAEVAIAKLDRINQTGVRIALDDFGEGYSSLGQLRELPIDILKIARPFVRELTDNDHDPALVRGIIELARSLGLRLVAEGIESYEQQAILRAFDCPLGQGFLFSRPVEAAALRAMLAQPAVDRVRG